MTHDKELQEAAEKYCHKFFKSPSQLDSEVTLPMHLFIAGAKYILDKSVEGVSKEEHNELQRDYDKLEIKYFKCISEKSKLKDDILKLQSTPQEDKIKQVIEWCDENRLSPNFTEYGAGFNRALEIMKNSLTNLK